MKISPSLRSNINKILLITSFYVLINWFFTFYNDVMLTSEFSLGRSDFYDLGMNLWANTLTGIFAGLGGSILIRTAVKPPKNKVQELHIHSIILGHNQQTNSHP